MFWSTQQAVISQAKQALGNTVRTVESWPGAWTEQMIKRLGTQAPAVYVHFANAKRNPSTGNWACDFALFVVANSFAAERGAIGASDMVQLLVPVLNQCGECAELDMTFSAQLDRQMLVVLELSYTITLATPTASAVDVTQFATFAADYGTQENAAADHLTLQETA